HPGVDVGAQPRAPDQVALVVLGAARRRIELIIGRLIVEHAVGLRVSGELDARSWGGRRIRPPATRRQERPRTERDADDGRDAPVRDHGSGGTPPPSYWSGRMGRLSIRSAVVQALMISKCVVGCM